MSSMCFIGIQSHRLITKLRWVAANQNTNDQTDRDKRRWRQKRRQRERWVWTKEGQRKGWEVKRNKRRGWGEIGGGQEWWVNGEERWKVTERRRINIKMNDVHSPGRSAAGSRVASPSQQNKLTDVGTNTTQQEDRHWGRDTETERQEHFICVWHMTGSLKHLTCMRFWRKNNCCLDKVQWQHGKSGKCYVLVQMTDDWEVAGVDGRCTNCRTALYRESENVPPGKEVLIMTCERLNERG